MLKTFLFKFQVATSGVNYGLYHEVPQIQYPHPQSHSHFGYYDRDGNEGPRFFLPNNENHDQS